MKGSEGSRWSWGECFFFMGKRRGKAKCKIQRFGLASTGSFFNLFHRFLKSFEMPFCQCCCVLVLCGAAAARSRTHECFAVSRLKDNRETCCPAASRGSIFQNLRSQIWFLWIFQNLDYKILEF